MQPLGNRMAILRRARGLSVAEVASHIGLTRQAVHRIEDGTYVPNTLVAIQLARLFGSSVEDIFGIAPDTTPVTVLPDKPLPRPGQPVQVCQVDDRLIASPIFPTSWYLPASDAVMASDLSGAQLLDPVASFQNRVLIAGCDPAVSVLARHLQSAAIDLIPVKRNSSQALRLLKENCVHLAGTHLRDEASGESNLPEIKRLFPRAPIAVFSFAVWEEGIVTAAGNPKNIRKIDDFAWPDVRLVNREKGAGTRILLDRTLKHLGIAPRTVRGYNRVASGHLALAAKIRSGEADCGIATRVAARAFGLDFVPLLTERYDLAIHQRHLELPAVQALLDTLTRARFRRELDCGGGYDTTKTGERLQ